MADSDSTEDRVTHAWAANMSPHVSPPPAQSGADQAPASSTTHGDTTTDVVGGAAAQNEDPQEEATGIITVHMTVETVTSTSAAAEEAAPPPSNSPPGRRSLADRRRIYKLHELPDGRQRLTPRDGILPECRDPALVYNEVLHIHWRDGQELRIHVHVRRDGRTVILRALRPEEQVVWEDILRANQGIEPRLIAMGETRLEPWSWGS